MPVFDFGIYIYFFFVRLFKLFFLQSTVFDLVFILSVFFVCFRFISVDYVLDLDIKKSIETASILLSFSSSPSPYLFINKSSLFSPYFFGVFLEYSTFKRPLEVHYKSPRNFRHRPRPGDSTCTD